MNKQKINVPRGIKFLSEWREFILPSYPHILNKQITGCGFTQWALTCPMNLILCSPRRVLLENKEDQYLEEIEKGSEFSYKIFYAKNEYEKVIDLGKDLNKDDRDKVIDITVPAEYTRTYKESIKEFFRSCQSDPTHPSFKYCKLLVTYDSYRKVKEALEELGVFNSFYTIVDEFQSIFVDAKFKASTELEFITILNNIQNLCYVSATPMMDEYLEMISNFKDLPYYELDWVKEEPTRIIKPKINPTPCSKLSQKISEIIEKYRTRQWKDSDNAVIRYRGSQGDIQEFWTKEAVFYINSVKNICDIIKKCNLKQEECNILCADTEDNRKKIRLAFGVRPKDFNGLGKVPKRSEMGGNKMFTLCTRTVYLGADFWSTNARSFVFSDANIDTLAVDISLDLPQILGRQRNDENPWKNELNVYFKPTIDKNRVSKEEFDSWIEEKRQRSLDMLRGVENNSSDYKAQIAILDQIEKNVNRDKYKDNYVSINTHEGSKKVAVFNDLVMISEKRAFEIQQVDYADRCSVRNTINSQLLLEGDRILTEFLELYESYTNFIDKMRLTCELFKTDISDSTKEQVLVRIDEQVANYIRVLGVDKIESHSYIRIRLDRELSSQLNNQFIDPSGEIYNRFQVGKKYNKPFIKSELKKIYNTLGYRKTPKATDLEEWFTIRYIKYIEGGKKINGFEIVNKKLQ